MRGVIFLGCIVLSLCNCGPCVYRLVFRFRVVYDILLFRIVVSVALVLSMNMWLFPIVRIFRLTHYNRAIRQSRRTM